MNVLDPDETVQLLCKLAGKWGVRIRLNCDECDEMSDVRASLPFLESDDVDEMFFNDGGVILCESEEEAERLYAAIMGVRPMATGVGLLYIQVYVYGPDGQLLMERSNNG